MSYMAGFYTVLAGRLHLKQAKTRTPGIKPGMAEFNSEPYLFGRLCVGRRCIRSHFGRSLSPRPFLHHTHRPDRTLVENEQRDCERHLADDVRWRQHGSQDECANDKIT